MMNPSPPPEKTIDAHCTNEDIVFMPGAVSVPFSGDGIPNDEFLGKKVVGHDEDDMEAKIAKKIMEEDDINHEYHRSVMKPDPNQNKRQRDWYFVWMGLLTLIFVVLVFFGFWSGLFLPNAAQEDVGSASSVERQAYMEELLSFFDFPLLEPGSPQEQAIEWLAYRDEPLPVPSKKGGNSLLQYQRVRLEQRYALVTFYFAQGGPKLWSSINRHTWAGWINYGMGVHECEWHGIDCEADNDDGNNNDNERRHVVALRLNPSTGVVLTGESLSTELGLLTSLRRLDFSSQRLEGSIPDEWKALTNLEMLALSKNQIQATIPEWIGDSWKQLKTLALNGNLVEGTLPTSILSLTNLKHLELQFNQKLQGRFDDLMVAIPDLEHLDISSTDLEGTIPSEVIMSNLRVFQAWNTQKLAGTIPSAMGQWQSLEIFSIDDIPDMKGTIPTEVGGLSNLQELKIIRVPLTGALPTELGNLSNLHTMVLSFLELKSTLPTEYGNLSNLETLDLNINSGLTGTIPTDYGKLVNLKYFDVSTTNLSGTVSTDVCDLKLDFFRADCPNKNPEPNDIICVCCTWCL